MLFSQELVITKTGVKKALDVHRGDYLLTPQGYYFFSGRELIYTCTHPWFVLLKHCTHCFTWSTYVYKHGIRTPVSKVKQGDLLDAKNEQYEVVKIYQAFFPLQFRVMRVTSPHSLFYLSDYLQVSL